MTIDPQLPAPAPDMPKLGITLQDRGASLAKGAVGMIPIAGSLIAEVVGQIIPDQRGRRLEDYCKRLNDRLSTMEERDLRSKLQDPERIDLFEDGAYQAARALTDERREYIVRLVAAGISGDDQARLEAKRLLKLLAEIGDDQVIILASKLRRHLQDRDYQELHEAVLSPPQTHMGSSQEDQNKRLMFELARSQLVSLGLTGMSYPEIKKGDIPEFDKGTGTVKGKSSGLTTLGRMLLHYIGLAEIGEY